MGRVHPAPKLWLVAKDAEGTFSRYPLTFQEWFSDFFVKKKSSKERKLDIDY